LTKTMKTFFALPTFLFFCFILVSAATVGREIREPSCEYVDETHLLLDTNAVRECFNSYVLPDCVVEGALAQIRVVVEMYPYIDIAKNPPTYPSQEYYGKVDVEQALDELDRSLNESDNVVSSVFRAIGKFITGFRDGHLYINVENTPDSRNIFAGVVYSLPFGWNYLPDSQGVLRVYIFSSKNGRDYDLGNQDHLDDLFSQGIYAESVDGKPAFDYLKDFLGEYNDMRSTQGRLHYARMNSIDGTGILQYPPEDDAFDEHEILFSNGEKYQFNMTFLNFAVRPERDIESPAKPPRRPRGMTLDSVEKTREILINHQPTILKDIRENKYVLCYVLDEANYISVPSFDCNGEEAETFENEMVTCISEFDKNSNPIVVNFPGNLGGNGDMTSLLGGLLNPNGDNEYVGAVRKTDFTKILTEAGVTFAQKLADDKCSDFTRTGKGLEEFWKNTEQDDYGNGVIHKRTQLLSSFHKSVEEKVKTYRLTNHTRKPTDIVVVTDSVCFSACSIFVNNVIEKGGGIVVGVGGYNPGDQLFVASQNPSSVLSLPGFPALKPYYESSGVSIHCTFMETFPVIRGETKMIPRDYTLSYIDKHLGVYPRVTHTTTEYDVDTVAEIIVKALQLREEFQESCNPNNPRLIFVNENCTSSDEHAMFVGYPCGSDGKCDKSKCVISACQFGYHVDFYNNKCVPAHCLTPSEESSAPKMMMSFIVCLVAFILLVL